MRIRISLDINQVTLERIDAVGLAPEVVPWFGTLKGSEKLVWPVPTGFALEDSGNGALTLSRGGAQTQPLSGNFGLVARFIGASLDVGGRELLGRYLFALLGGSRLSALLDAGANALQVVVAPDLPDLPWELAIDDTGPLVRRASIVRIACVCADAPIQLPRRLRVLIVLGRAPGSDAELQPAMEIVSALRMRERDPDDLPLVTRLRIQASEDELKQTVQRFRPDVVHIASHGRLHPTTGRPQVELRDRTDSSDDMFWFDAAKLASMLNVADPQRRPKVVVLNTCHGANADGRALSLARELAVQGVPHVLGLSGKVKDVSCRVAARAAFTALMSGKTLSEAIQQTRAHILEDGDADWARLALFSSGVVLTPAGAAADDPSALALRAFKWTEEHSRFCDRVEELARWDALLEALGNVNLNVPRVAVITETSQYKRGDRLGCTWTATELSLRAARVGHLPIFVDLAELLNAGQPGPGGQAPGGQPVAEPTLDIRGIAQKLHTRLIKVCLALEASALTAQWQTPDWSLPAVFAVQDGLAPGAPFKLPLDSAIDGVKPGLVNFSPDPLSEALQLAARRDLAALAARWRALAGEQTTVVLVLDHLERVGPGALTLARWLTDGSGTAALGMGARWAEPGAEAQRWPVPVVVACHRGDAGLDKELARLGGNVPALRIELAPWAGSGPGDQGYARIVRESLRGFRLASPPHQRGYMPAPKFGDLLVEILLTQVLGGDSRLRPGTLTEGMLSAEKLALHIAHGSLVPLPDEELLKRLTDAEVQIA